MNFNKIIITTLILMIVTGLGACDLLDPDDILDPNNPPQEIVLENANLTQLQSLVTGLESRHRGYADNSSDLVALFGTFGREFYPMFESDPRFIEQWMGRDSEADALTDGSFFASASSWNTPYNAIKQANLLIEAVNNTDAVTDQQRSGYTGFAKTIQGFQFLIPLMAQYDNGIRVDVSDPLNPGPFVGYDEALTHIRNLLDEGRDDLQNAGSSFAFTLHSGFADFNTPQTMLQLNRAIAARAAIYAEAWDDALSALDDAEPFFELAEGEDVMNKGAYHVYGAPPDAFNPWFYPRNAETSQILMVHPDMVNSAEANDLRVEQKFFERDAPVTLQGLSSRWQDNRFNSNTDPFAMIRNEELILIYAEANTRLGGAENLNDAIDAINMVRNTWGVGPYGGNANEQELIDEILFQRRYSLWGEFGHSWIDARRYDRLDTLPDDGGVIWPKLARRTVESSWDDFAGDN